MRVRKIEGFLAETAASHIREPSPHWQVEDVPTVVVKVVIDLRRLTSMRPHDWIV